MIKRLMRRAEWWQYTQQVKTRWRQWDRFGGGQYAAEQIAPYQLLSRPSFNPQPLSDPIFSTPRFALAGPQHKWREFVEYVYHIRKPCYLEPEFGYLIMEPSVLIPEALAWSRLAREKEDLNFFSGVPSVKQYQEARLGKRPVRHEPIIISLRHVFGDNYGHCLVQLMPTLLLLDDCGVSPDIPIVVSSKVGNAPFFQEMIQRGALRKRRWIIQEEAYIHADEVIFGWTEWPDKSLLTRFLDMIEAPQSDANQQRRLFILRRRRQMQNMDSLLPIIKELEFEMVRPEEFSFAQQMELFSQVSIVCGVLGAALTNTIFRRDSPMQMLEICTLLENDPFFYALAKTCGFSYRCLVGSRYETRDRNSSFSVDREQFEAFLHEAVAGSAGPCTPLPPILGE
jgi:capsular polysaccharide biosynthesis protein